MIGSWELQKALVAALKTAGVAGGRVYDHGPSMVDSPYVVFGETQPIKADVQGRSGADEFVTLHIWDEKHRGQKQIKETGAAIETALHAQNISVTGRETAFVTVRDMRTMGDPDGLTQHGVLTLRVQHFGQLAQE